MPKSALVPITVVIPAHNEARFIRQSIESIHAQTVPVSEIIVVADDCSDDTALIAESLGVKVVEIKARNISAARNAGVRAASHDWIAFQDADDFWATDKIERQLRAIEAFPEADVVSCDFFVIYDAEPIGIPEKALRLRRENVADAMIVSDHGTYFPKVDGRVLRWYEVAPQAVMFRRQVFDIAGFFDEDLVYLQDIEFTARCLKDHSLVMVEVPLVYRRIRTDSHSANSEGKWSAYFSIVDRMLKFPDRYAPLAGEQYREHLKFVFAGNERVLADKRRRLGADHLNNPNQ